MKDNHGHCPNCNLDLNGGSIWATFNEKYADEAKADEIAAMYGATRDTGSWGKAISIYDMERDITVAWKCPECNHQWERK